MRRRVTSVRKLGKSKLSIIRNRVLAGLIAGGLIVGSATIPIVGKINEIKSYPENTYGYSSVMLYDFIHNQPNTFVLLDAGDYNTIGTFMFDKKIEYCHENDMSIGIVINEKEISYNAIYKDVELAKSIIKEHKNKIDLPVFFNIDNIIENYDLTSEEKTNLIVTFLTKCESNGMFVGLHGKDVNLKRCKEICENIKEYDACVVIDNEENKVEYDGNYNYVEHPNGRITAKENFSKYVIEGNMNVPERFVSDSIYTVSNGENILDIAIKFNMSPNDLLRFNNLDRKDIKGGTILRIPSVLGKYTPFKQAAGETLTEPLVGADVSNHQMHNKYEYNPDKIAKSFDFIIIKATEGTGWIDQSFDKISKDCIDRDIPIGVYALSTITDTNLSENEVRKRAEAQAEHCLNVIKNKKISYPVYLDFEGDSQNMLLNAPEKFKVILDVWYEKVSGAGYTPGLYMNSSMYNNMIGNTTLNNESFDLNENFEMWIAGGDYYVQEPNNNSSKEVWDRYNNTFYTIEDIKKMNGEDNIEVQQGTNVGDGRIYGAANAKGKLDINLSYKDYTNVPIPEDINPELLDIMDLKQYPDGVTVGMTLGGLAVAVATGVMIKRKSRRRRR